jgi:flagellar biosynthesis protein FliR
VPVIPLDAFLIGQVYAFLLVFARVGTALMFMPVFGEVFVSSTIRLMFALVMSLLLAPVLMPTLPVPPTAVPAFATLIATEAFIGLFLGVVARMVMSALEMAGMVISLQTGLAAAAMFNPAIGTQGSPFGSILGVLGITLLVVTDLHHLLLAGVANSYALFPPGGILPVNDFAETTMRLVGQSFSIGTQMAAPFVIGGIVLNVALGVLSRLVPQMQIFFVALPIQIAGGLVLFLVSLSSAMLVWLTLAEETIVGIFGSG